MCAKFHLLPSRPRLERLVRQRHLVLTARVNVSVSVRAYREACPMIEDWPMIRRAGFDLEKENEKHF
jgi:hypothetical protein